MTEGRDLYCRRSFLAFVASAATASALGQSEAASLVADDGSPVRVIETGGRPLVREFAHAQGFGAQDPDVILVEFFDYNCGYCRSGWLPMAGLLADDARIALHLVHFPILSRASEDAAAMQQAVFSRDGPSAGAELHGRLMASQGRIDKDSARAACAMLQIGEPTGSQIDQAREEIAQTRKMCARFGIRFTPTFSIADTTFVGWPGPTTITALVAEVRRCGRLNCS